MLGFFPLHSVLPTPRLFIGLFKKLRVPLLSCPVLQNCCTIQESLYANNDPIGKGQKKGRRHVPGCSTRLYRWVWQLCILLDVCDLVTLWVIKPFTSPKLQTSPPWFGTSLPWSTSQFPLPTPALWSASSHFLSFLLFVQGSLAFSTYEIMTILIHIHAPMCADHWFSTRVLCNVSAVR